MLKYILLYGCSTDGINYDDYCFNTNERDSKKVFHEEGEDILEQ